MPKPLTAKEAAKVRREVDRLNRRVAEQEHIWSFMIGAYTARLAEAEGIRKAAAAVLVHSTWVPKSREWPAHWGFRDVEMNALESALKDVTPFKLPSRGMPAMLRKMLAEAKGRKRGRR